MNLKNYTSETPAERSISRIEKKLVEIGAKNINKEYDGFGGLQSVKFLIDINGQTVVFDLPARVKAVYDVLAKEVKRPQEGTYARIRAQAERTAWKLIADWVDVQASMIHLQQAEVMQVFLPYALMPTGKTLYQTFVDNPQKMLQ